MAKKEEQKPKTMLERIYNVPLRKGCQKAPKWKRTKKAVSVLREFIAKHMKSEDVKIGKYLNQRLWQHGIRNPPHHIKVSASKDEEGKVFVELADLPKEALLEKEKVKEEEKKKKEKEEKKEGIEGKLEKEAEKKEEKDEKAGEAQKIEKEELKELKKETPKIKPPKETPLPKAVEQRPTAPMQK
jgi:large subunit ribosomal protein L31e